MEITSPLIVNGDTSSDPAIFIEHILSQECLDKSVLRTKDHLEMGIGCACTAESQCGRQHTCIIAVSRHTTVRDITERIPTP